MPFERTKRKWMKINAISSPGMRKTCSVKKRDSVSPARIGPPSTAETSSGPIKGTRPRGATPEADRDPVRRFRGRLAAPVTIATAGASDARAGLTVSSLMVSEGDPGRIHLLLGPLADIYRHRNGILLI